MKKILITKRLTALLWALVLTLMPMSLMADNTPLSVTVTFEVGSFVYEQAGNAFDGKPETKWCGGILTTNNTNASVQVQLAEKSKLDYYYLYTGNDINYKDDDSQQQRNPKEWKLYAKVNEGDEWTLISHVTDAGLPTTVSTRSNNYKIDAAYQNIEYNYLKFEILQIEKGDIFEVGEICFIKCNHTFGSDDICTECGYEKQEDTASAQDVDPDPSHKLKKNENGYFKIGSDADFEAFRQVVATGNPYACAVLTGNIHAKKPIGGGDEQFHYRGIFDGQGFTIDVDSLANDNENHPWGLFQFTEPGCVIRNLKVTGKLTSGHEYLGSIVGEAVGTRIENCVSDATLVNSSSTLPYTGGIIGGCHGVNFVENCAFIGEINAEEKACGLIGYAHHNVEIKSCYVDAKFSNPDNSNQFLNSTDTYKHIFRNNYYHKKGAQNVPAGQQGATDEKPAIIEDNQLTNGELCLNLNINGRNGVVWYQHGAYPLPFKGDNGVMISKNDDGNGCGHNYSSTHICQNCGEKEPGYTVEPNQRRNGVNSKNELTVSHLIYKLHSDRTPKTAELLGYNMTDGITAVHVPETINIDGVVYTVNYFMHDALRGLKMEYCYIPWTITHIDDDAFTSCTQLKNLHIADCPSQGEKSLYIGHKDEDLAMFADCPLDKIYIGRDMRWYTESNGNPDEPFECTSATKVFFGPRVTRVGNYSSASKPRQGLSYDLFNNSKKIKKVYLMGDELSAYQKAMEFWCVDGLCEATEYYINRSVEYTEYFVFSSGPISEIWSQGCLDKCTHVTYGPFVTSIPQKSFEGAAVDNNTTLESADFTNAFRLDAIGPYAFAYAHKTAFASNPFKNCQKLRAIGEKAFTDCDGIRQLTIPSSVIWIYGQAFDDCDNLESLVIDDGDTGITFYGDAAFNDCDNLVSIYHGRNFEYKGESPYEGCDLVNTLVIGPKVTKLNYNGYKDMKNLGALSFLHSSTPLLFESLPDEVFYDTKPRSLFIDRELKRMSGNSVTDDLQFGENFTKYVDELSFGDHITSINANRFSDFKVLKTVLMPYSVKNIGKSAFKGCVDLETVFALGDVTVGAEAFSGCTNLRHLFLMGQRTYLGENAFAGCKNIEEVATGFTSDPPAVEGYEYANAFTNEAYTKAHFMCAADTETHKVKFNSVPWSLFKERKSLYATNNFDEGIDPAVGDYEHASIAYNFSEGKYEFLHVPFDIDPYYFGADAEIYSVGLSDGNPLIFDDEAVIRGKYKYTSIPLDKCDIDEQKTLHPGFYLVKTNYPADAVKGFHSLFDSQLIHVDDSVKYAMSTTNSIMYANPDADALGSTSSMAKFVMDDGMLKLINGEYTNSPNAITICYNVTAAQPHYDLINGDTGLLLSSKIDIPFSAMLEGYASFYALDCNYIAPEWCKVYIVTGAEQGDELELTEITDRTITKGQAVLLYTDSDIEETTLTEHLTHATNASSCSFEGNLLKGVDKDQTVSQLPGQAAYILDNQNRNTGFYKASSDRMLTKGTAYLDPAALSSAMQDKSCIFLFDTVATAIKPAGKAETQSAVYDLMGRRLQEAGLKGIYIVNGKKVIIK